MAKSNPKVQKKIKKLISEGYRTAISGDNERNQNEVHFSKSSCYCLQYAKERKALMDASTFIVALLVLVVAWQG